MANNQVCPLLREEVLLEHRRTAIQVGGPTTHSRDRVLASNKRLQLELFLLD